MDRAIVTAPPPLNWLDLYDVTTPTNVILSNKHGSETRNKTLTALIRCESECLWLFIYYYFFQTSWTAAFSSFFLFNLFADFSGFRLMDYIVFFMAAGLAESCVCVFVLSF